MTIKDLQNELNVSRRSAYRVLERLQDDGFPVYDDDYGPDRHKIWRMDEGHLINLPSISFPDLSLDRKELILLNLMLGSEHNLENSEFGRVRKSLKMKLLDWTKSQTSADADLSGSSRFITQIGTGRKSYVGSEQILDDLLSAIASRNICTATYDAMSRGEQLFLELRPLRLFEWRQGFYVFCLLEPELPERILAIERFIALEKTKRSFPKSDSDPEKLLANAFSVYWNEPISLKIHFCKSVAPYVKARRWAQDQKFEDRIDGSTIMTMSTSGHYDILYWILGFGPDAKVLEPDWMVEEIRDYLARACNQYSE